MPGDSPIEWTDRTWNFVTGCTRVSAGCDHCYAFALHDRRHGAWQAGRWPDAPEQYQHPFAEVQVFPERILLPTRWRKPARIFVDSMSDFWHADIHEEYVLRAFAVMAVCQWHRFQILTKRPQRMRRVLTEPAFASRVQIYTDYLLDIIGARYADGRRRQDGLRYWAAWPLPNVWLGVSIEDNAVAWRADVLRATPAAVRFLSCEPLIGPVDQVSLDCAQCDGAGRDDRGRPCWACRGRGLGIHWVITGGESGPDARPFDPAWARQIRDRCRGRGVAYFHKQNGGRTSKAGGRLLDGRTWDEFPEVARV